MSRVARPVLLLLACIAMAGAGGAQPAAPARTDAEPASGVRPAPAPDAAPEPVGSPPASVGGERSLEERIVTVSERVKPSVVHVEAIVRINDRRSEVTGSGLVASADGLVLTNQHVVEKAEKVEVHVPGHKTPYPAEVLGTDLPTDVALLRIDAPGPLPAAVFGRSDALRVGQWVLAIGNPYGLEGTVSLGIVSAKGRNLEIPELLNDFIQTDAMIDRGSSGGPLVDLEGRVVGLNSRGQGRGIGFTIPIETALGVMEQLRHGGVARGWLGVSVQALDRELAAYLGMPDATGVIVNGVSEGSPAERAGFRPGDVVTHVEGVAVEAEKEEDLGAFQRRIASFEPGRSLTLGLLREGRAREMRVELGEQPRVEPAEAETDVGFHVQEITEGLYREARLASREGAYVSFVARGSPAAEAGLFAGDVVERVDERAVADLADFERAMAAVADADRFLLRARRGSDLMLLLVKRGARPTTPSGPAPGAGEAAAGGER